MLLTNGCSFVWGDELEGYTRNKHHKHTFAYKLSRHLDIPYENLACCGSGNPKIFRDTINYLRNSKNKITHMVILWSSWARDELAEPNISDEKLRKIQRWQCMTQISPSRLHLLEPEIGKALDILYDVYDPGKTGILHTLTYMSHIEWLCEILNIKLIQGVFHRQSWDSLRYHMDPRALEWKPWQDYVREIIENLKDTSRIGMNRWEDMYTISVRNDDIKPYEHPGEQTHEDYAQLLYEIFETEEYWSEE